MTDTELINYRDEAFKAFQALQQAKRNEATIYLIQGKILKDIRDKKLYKYLGNGGFDDFQQFCNNPEIAMNHKTAHAYIGVYELYIEELGYTEADLIEIPLRRLIKLKPHLKKMETQQAIQTVDELKGLTHSDYVQETKTRKLQTEKPMLLYDTDSGKYVFHFKNDQMLEIKCLDDQRVLLDNRSR